MKNLTSSQLLFVCAEGSDSPKAKIALYERESLQDPWKRTLEFAPCLLGEKGLAWGLGLHTNPQGAQLKCEGDMRAPMGIFPITAAFGEHPKETLQELQLDYLHTHPFMEYVDDPRSKYYNQCVDLREVSYKDWNSSEKMLREDDLYKLGLIVGHNEHPITPGLGSCIFIHTWRNQSKGSAGCTVFDSSLLRQIVLRLQPQRSPLLVQGTSDALFMLKKEFVLPEF